jgi:hypothetical protein
MNFADVNVRYLGSWARRDKCSCGDRNHFVVLMGKGLPRPSPYAAADKNKACKADSRTCHQACKAKCDPKGKEDRPRRVSRHLDGLSWALFFVPNIHHHSPPDEVHDCKHQDPDAIDEVPIKSDYAKALTLPRIDPAEQRENECRG